MNSFSLRHWPLGRECSQLPFDRWEHQSPSLLHPLVDFENCWPICSTQIWDLSFSQAKRHKIPKSEKMLCSPDLFRPACAACYINHICFSAEPSQPAEWSAHQPPSYQASCLCHHFPQSDINIHTNTQENWTSSQTRIFLFLKLFPSLLSSWQDASVRSLDILTFLSVNSANQPGVQAPSRTVWVLGMWKQEDIRGPGFSQKNLTVWICWLYFNSDTKMKIRIVWGVYFLAPGPCPQPPSCQVVLSAPCLLSNWSLFKETVVFLSRHLVERMEETKRGWWGRELVLDSGRRAPQLQACRLGCCEGLWTRARETEIPWPSNWLFSCISERPMLAGTDSYCFLLLPLGVEAKEVWGKDAAFRGRDRDRRSPSPEAPLFRYGGGRFFSNPGWDEQRPEAEPDKKAKTGPWMHGWRRRRMSAGTMDTWNFWGLNDFSVLCGMDNMNVPESRVCKRFFFFLRY